MGRFGGGPSSGTSTQRGSWGSGTAIAAKAARASRTRRVSGPCTAMSWAEIGRGAAAAVKL